MSNKFYISANTNVERRDEYARRLHALQEHITLVGEHVISLASTDKVKSVHIAPSFVSRVTQPRVSMPGISVDTLDGTLGSIGAYRAYNRFTDRQEWQIACVPLFARGSCGIDERGFNNSVDVFHASTACYRLANTIMAVMQVEYERDVKALAEMGCAYTFESDDVRMAGGVWGIIASNGRENL